MKINCDLGESQENWDSGQDKQLLKLVDMVNISCGVHAGNEKVIKETIDLAFLHQKEIGAHPSYPDRENFGRKSIAIEPGDLRESLFNQIETLAKWTKGSLQYVKPHGALYHDCMTNPEVLGALLQAMSDLNLNIPIMLLAGFDSQYPIINEAFIDRKYLNFIELLPRSHPQSLITEPKDCLAQYIDLTENQSLTSLDGKKFKISADSLCIHSDTINALNVAEEISKYKANKAY